MVCQLAVFDAGKYKNKYDNVCENVLRYDDGANSDHLVICSLSIFVICSLSILCRTAIVSAFYQMFSLMLVILCSVMTYMPFPEYMESAVFTLRAFVVTVLCSMALSVTMYLMMEHNTDSYVYFLRFLRLFYLDYLCFCCCHHIVDRQTLIMTVEPTANTEAEQPMLQLTTPGTIYPNISEGCEYAVAGACGSPDTVTIVMEGQSGGYVPPQTPFTPETSA